MTRKRPKAVRSAEAPITGVAAGGLGTAANLDDTQIMRTEDLQAAAAEAAAASPDWLDDGPAAAPDPDLIPPDELALLQAASDRTPPSPLPIERAAPVAEHAAAARAVGAPAAERRAPTAAVTPFRPSRRRRNAPALAGVAAFVVLLLIAGSGFLSQLDLGVGSGPAGPAATAGALIDAAPSPSAEPKKDEGKGGRGKCHDHGHGNNC